MAQKHNIFMYSWFNAQNI